MNWIRSKFDSYYSILNFRKLIGFGILLILLFSVAFFYSDSEFNWLYVALLVVQLLGFFVPPLLRIEYAFLSLVFYPVGLIISTLVLLLMYSLIFVPLGLLRKRIFSSGWVESVKEIDATKMYE